MRVRLTPKPQKAVVMTGDWGPDARRYLGRVTKAQILEAVTEAAGAAPGRPAEDRAGRG